MKRATAEDDDFRVQVACRCSSRLSPFLLSSFSDLAALVEGLPSIAEAVEAIEAEAGEGVLTETTVVRSPSSMLSSSPDLEECSSVEEGVSPNPVVASSEVEILSNVASSGSSTLSPTTAVPLCQDSSDAGVLQDDRTYLVLSESMVADGVPPCPSAGASGQLRMKMKMPEGDAGVVGVGEGPVVVSFGGRLCIGREVVGAALCTDEETVSFYPPSLSCVAAAITGGGVEIDKGQQVIGCLGTVRLGAAGLSCVPLLPTSCDRVGLCDGGLVSEEARVSPVAREAMRSQPTDGLRQPPSSPVGLCDGGLVSEEARVSPVAREAMRSQPTDGLRQPPSSPVVPVSGAERGVGKDGTYACRSFAHVVQADRRADVQLSYLPPPDGGNSIIMEEADGDKQHWGSCLVGHFLQGTLPFCFVKSSVTRQWSKFGLTEVKSLDEGFFMFRFGDSSSRDGVFEGRPWFVEAKPLTFAQVGVSPITHRGNPLACSV
ncbi:hypothetical protein Dimus_036478 [Dionaea muscipula]